jgi:hypothetical protein
MRLFLACAWELALAQAFGVLILKNALFNEARGKITQNHTCTGQCSCYSEQMACFHGIAKEFSKKMKGSVMRKFP